MKRRSQATEKTRAKSPYFKHEKAPYSYNAMYAALPLDSLLRAHRIRMKQTKEPEKRAS